MAAAQSRHGPGARLAAPRVAHAPALVAGLRGRDLPLSGAGVRLLSGPRGVTGSLAAVASLLAQARRLARDDMGLLP